MLKKVNVRIADEEDAKCLLMMPPYAKYDFETLAEEQVLVAEAKGGIVGAISIGQKDMFYSSSETEEMGPAHSTEIWLPEIRGPWISKLFVLPEHRNQGVGTRLVDAAVQLLREKGHAQAYAGVNVENLHKEFSERTFLSNGFSRIGFCNCALTEHRCRGVLLKKTLMQPETADDNERLTREIRSLGLSTGAELVGFASTEDFEKQAPQGHKPSDILPTAKSIVVLACGRKLNEDRHYFYRWGPHFSLTYIRLKEETKRGRKEARQCIDAVKNFLGEKGFKAALEAHGWSGILSFKTAANSAGVGVVGNGGFIVHPTLGPLNVLGCVLTDATLKYDVPLKVDVCRDCKICVEACKYGAYRRVADCFQWIGEKCRSYDLIMNPVTLMWTYGPCNSKCVHACPIGTRSWTSLTLKDKENPNQSYRIA